jgi:hypothetical protein
VGILGTTRKCHTISTRWYELSEKMRMAVESEKVVERFSYGFLLLIISYPVAAQPAGNCKAGSVFLSKYG